MTTEKIGEVEITKLNGHLCDVCRFKDTFICNKIVIKGIENFLPFTLQIFETNKSGIKLVLESYKEVLNSHRNGKYFTFNFTPLHCSEYTKECKCSEHRCWNYEEIASRKLARCIRFLGIDIDIIKELEGYDIDSIFFIIDFTDCKEVIHTYNK